MKTINDTHSCYLTIPYANILYELLTETLINSEKELKNNFTEEKRKKYAGYKLLHCAIKQIIKEGVGKINFFTNTVPQLNENGEFEGIPVGY